MPEVVVGLLFLVVYLLHNRERAFKITQSHVLTSNAYHAHGFQSLNSQITAVSLLGLGSLATGTARCACAIKKLFQCTRLSAGNK
jgi:uncharacterized membrane protein HdeD (DUF308 family)